MRSRLLLLFSIALFAACHRHRHQKVAAPPPAPPTQAPPAAPVHRSQAPPRKAERPPSPPPAAPSASTPPPVLVPALSPTERDAAEQAIHAATQRARSVLARASNVALSPAQQDTARRIRAFLQQAESALATDLVTARGFAERAGTLAQDLDKSLP